MLIRNAVAAKVAERKAQHPERYCPATRCLWNTGDGSYCPRHRRFVDAVDAVDAVDTKSVAVGDKETSV